MSVAPLAQSSPAPDVVSAFHPAVARWFQSTHGEPSEPQRRGWPLIRARRHTLIAAPTGSGKTLAAFLAALDELVRAGLEGTLKDEVRVLYVSPLKALSNDIDKNLAAPLSGIGDELERLGLPRVEIRSLVRTGDTKASERAKLRKAPPHILVTTPETLYILLTSESGRAALGSVRTVIIDEIHAMVGDKRGAHLALSLERLSALVQHTLTRVGLSATQRPIELVAQFLVGMRAQPDGAPDCAIVDCGHRRRMSLGIELPRSPLDAVMSGEVWGEVYDRIARLVEENTTTLVFVGNRRLAERLCKNLEERVGVGKVAAHHGSLAKETRLDAERRLKAGELRALVATASLELGIDIGAVDLVCQIGSPRSIARLLQRVGRAGHQLGGVPRGLVFPLSRNDLVECVALHACTLRGELDAVRVPEAPLDILAQQIVAMAACEEWDEAALLECVRRAYPYRELPEGQLRAVLDMLASGFDSGRGRRRALIRHDRVTRTVQGRRAARLTALQNGGAIPDNTDYRVVLEPDEVHIGSIGEDFAIESMAGDIFQLGNASWRILKVETGVVRVADAAGQPPSIPFWFGEAPARSDELSRGVARLAAELEERLDAEDAGGAGQSTLQGFADRLGVPTDVAAPVFDYLWAARQSLGALPTDRRIIVERFFDEAENTHVVIHSRFGARINRAWGLALRKRFCKTFNFELQAAANEDAFVLSLGPTHSFELSELGQFLRSTTARDVLVQALLDAPMFEIRWRHNATRALAVPRNRAGRRVPAHLVRIRANDLLATTFPDQQACLENIPGERQIPDHPLVQQTIHDCLTEAMDVDGFLALLRAIEAGAVEVLYRDVSEPSPLSHEILNANPYAFLDPAPLEERRTRAVMTRRFTPETARDLGALDREAIERVRSEAWPDYATADELLDAAYVAGFISEAELDRPDASSARPANGAAGTDAAALATRLCDQGRATWLELPWGGRLLVSAERVALLLAMVPGARQAPRLTLPPELCNPVASEDAFREIARGRLSVLGPITERQLSAPLLANATPEQREPITIALQGALLALEDEGSAMRGQFTPGERDPEWCDRSLLARIHRYTLERLRREIEPVTSACFMRFLFVWQRVSPQHHQRGPHSLPGVLAQLEGFQAAAAAWESGLIAARLADYDPSWLDAACLSGQIAWGRLCAPNSPKALRSLASTPIVIVRRESWWWLASERHAVEPEELSDAGRRVLAMIEARGACFFQELTRAVSSTEELVTALSELVAAGRIASDSYGGMRGLLPAARRSVRRGRPAPGLESAGRWSTLSGAARDEAGLAPLGGSSAGTGAADVAERWARLLLLRYGVVFRALLERECAPPWRELVAVLRRLEARGEVRGGRFVQRHAGEQFALPEAIPLLRGERNARARGEEVCLSACDPLNLLGTVLPGERVTAAPQNAIVFRDAAPLAVLEAGAVRYLEALDEGEQRRAELLLRRGPGAFTESAREATGVGPRRAVA